MKVKYIKISVPEIGWPYEYGLFIVPYKNKYLYGIDKYWTHWEEYIIQKGFKTFEEAKEAGLANLALICERVL